MNDCPFLRILAAGVAAVGVAAGAHAANSVTIVNGSLTQGTVKASLTGGAYAVETNDLSDFPLDTGAFGGSAFPINFVNPNYNGNAFGGNADTMVAFGNGGGVTLKFDQAIADVDGQKEFGIFTAQAITGGVGSFFNGNMEAAILVSANGADWVTLDGTAVTDPTAYTATSHKLNAPTMAYDFGNAALANSYGFGTSQANLDALTAADFETPMVNDDLFNGSGTDAQRLALLSDSSTATYDGIFGDSAGGNWFDIANTGLSEVNYLRLNGVNVPSGGGIRLDAVFATPQATIPEPASLVLLGLAGLGLTAPRRRR